VAAIEGAKGEEDFRAASAEFLKAVNLAPWLGDAYRNLAIARDKSGQYDAALNNLRLYLLTSPSPADEAWAKSLINKVEYRKEKAAKESSPAAMAEKKRQEEEAFLKKIDGARYKYRYSDSRDEGDLIFDIRGNQVINGLILTYSRFSPENVGRYKRRDMAPLNGREFALPPSDGYWCGFLEHNVVEKGRISDDGESITTQVCNETRTYRRER
jgi:tetratricopeptide (TPR) repeat protein